MTKNTARDIFTNYFTNVTKEAVASYEYYVSHDYEDEGDFTVDSQIVYELYKATHESNDFAEESDFAEGDAGTFGFADNDDLFKDVENFFANDNQQIYLVDQTWFEAVKAFYMDHFGLVFDAFPANITSPYAFTETDQTYVALNNLDTEDEKITKQTLNWGFFNGSDMNDQAIEFFIKTFNSAK